MQIKAELNHLHIAPRKVRLVAGLIRGLDLARAELELNNLPKRSAIPLLKLLKSAEANARHNFQLQDPKDLVIKTLTVNQGSMLKRFRPRAFGRAAMIRKKTSHVYLVLETRQFAGEKVSKKTAPVLKDMPIEGLKEKDAKKMKIPAQFLEQTNKASKSKGFMKKVFQRKAI